MKIHFLVGLDNFNKYPIQDKLDILLKSYSKFSCNVDHKLVLCFPKNFNIPKKYLKYNIFKFKNLSITKNRYENVNFILEYIELIKDEKDSIICIVEPDMIFYKSSYFFNISDLQKINIYWDILDKTKIDSTNKLQIELCKKEGYDIDNFKTYVFSGSFFPQKYFNILEKIFKENKRINIKYNHLDIKFIACIENFIDFYLSKDMYRFNDMIKYKDTDPITDKTLFIHYKKYKDIKGLI